MLAALPPSVPRAARSHLRPLQPREKQAELARRRKGLVFASPNVDEGAIGDENETAEKKNLDDKGNDSDDLSPLETADDAGLAAGRRRRRRRPRSAASKATAAAETLDESSSSPSPPLSVPLRTVTRPLPRVLVLHTGGTLGMDVSTSFVEATDGHVAEGVSSCASILSLASSYDVEMPLTDAVYRVCHRGLSVDEAVVLLLGRSTKPE